MSLLSDIKTCYGGENSSHGILFRERIEIPQANGKLPFSKSAARTRAKIRPASAYREGRLHDTHATRITELPPPLIRLSRLASAGFEPLIPRDIC
jgi:hypothetical protein